MRPSRLFVISLTDLPKDTEILLTYVSPHLDLNPRREKLARDYLFTCSCPVRRSLPLCPRTLRT